MCTDSSSNLFRNVIRVPSSTRQRFLQLEQEATAELTKLGVRLAGIGTFGLDYEVGYRDPACHLVLLTLSGRGFFRSNMESYIPTAGDLLVSPLGVPMLLGTIDESWTFVWFYIHGLNQWKHLDGTQPVLRRPSFAAQLLNSVEGLLAESGHAGTQSVLTENGWVGTEPGPIIPSSRTANLFGALVAEYLREILRPPNHDSDPWEATLQEMWKAVEQSPGLNWSQERICRRLGVSPATLQRLVRRLFASSPQQIVISIRMNQARRLLQHSDYPLSLIAREVGYADAFVLSAAFKRFHGTSPNDFRNQTTAT